MEAILLALAAAAGASALWWHQARTQRQLGPGAPRFATDAEVAIHVARHEAQARGHAVSSVHVLYGLLQDDALREALEARGHDPEKLEARVVDELDRLADPHGAATEDLIRVLNRAAYSAVAGERELSARDLWAYLASSRAADVLDAAKVSHVAVLFQLCHGAEPAIDGAGQDVFIVLRNDDYTTREFVCEVLAQVFTFNSPDADARMMQTHTEGRAVLGRFAADEARTRIARTRELARERGFPLWIGIEPI
jgi:ATP-dependent Clp protease adaptor protein ClpS